MEIILGLFQHKLFDCFLTGSSSVLNGAPIFSKFGDAMDPLAPTQITHLFQGDGSVSERLHTLHNRLLETSPQVCRIACAIYDHSSDLLKTFVNSTRVGNAIQAYQAKLTEVPSLLALAQQGQCRVIDQIPLSIQAGAAHSNWLLEQPYLSSFTVPMYDNGQFLGFIFFDSDQPNYFSHAVQRDLLLYSNLINMALSSELSAVRAILASAQVARDFAHLRDFETGAHLERMARYAQLIAQGVASTYKLSDETIEHIYLFAPLHDIGKIGIADQILLKQGPLTDLERAEMQTHVQKGEDIMLKVIGDFGLDHLPDSQVMRNIVACHHEMLDGSGYPRGLKGEQVPIEARIVTVADIFDALTSLRPYKQPWPVPKAFAELDQMVAAGKLDGLCVQALKDRIATAQWIVASYPDQR